MIDDFATNDPMKEAANQVGLKAARRILDGLHDFETKIEGVKIDVVATRSSASAWPKIEGLTEAKDGPWPAPVRARCVWASGSVDLELRVSPWQGANRYRHLVGIAVATTKPRRDLVWITVPLPLMDKEDGYVDEHVVSATVSPPREKAQKTDPIAKQALLSVVKRAGLSFSTRHTVEAFRIRLTQEDLVVPSATAVFERLCVLALAKLPFFVPDAKGVTGSLPFVASDVVIEDVGLPEEPTESGKRAGLWPLPGGVRQYKTTLDALLAELAAAPMSVEALYNIFRNQYGITGESSLKSYVMILGATEMTDTEDGTIALTDLGRQYLKTKDPGTVFDRLHAAFIGMLEPLVLAHDIGALTGEATQERMLALLDVDWESPNQVNFRRNWLYSLGLTERRDDGDHLTDLGRETLDRYASEVAVIRARVGQVLDETGPAQPSSAPEAGEPRSLANVPDVAPGLDAPTFATKEEPTAWSEESVDLRAEHVAPFAKDLVLPPNTIERAVAAISAGKHLLLVGPPGTAKTELAHFIAQAARREGYVAGAFVATASADWTTFDTIGGYALQRDGSLKFKEARCFER